jgi:hypothetical protein
VKSKPKSCLDCVHFGIRDCCGAPCCAKGEFTPGADYSKEDLTDEPLSDEDKWWLELAEDCEEFQPYKAKPVKKRKRK